MVTQLHIALALTAIVGVFGEFAIVSLPPNVPPIVFPKTTIPVLVTFDTTGWTAAAETIGEMGMVAIVSNTVTKCPVIETISSTDADGMTYLEIPELLETNSSIGIGAFYKLEGNRTRIGNKTTLLDPSDCDGVTWELIGLSQEIRVGTSPDSELLSGSNGGMLWVGSIDTPQVDRDHIIHLEGSENENRYVGTRVVYNTPACTVSPFDGVEEFTLEAWVSAKETFNPDMKQCCWTVVSSVTSDSDPADKLWLGFADEGILEFHTPSGLTGDCSVHRTAVSAGNYLPWDTSIHIAGVYNKTSNTKSIYVNGVLQQQWQCEGTLGTLNIPRFSLGLGRISYLDGYLDEVRVWSTARSATEIRSAMNRHLYAHELKDLIMYYDMDTPTTDGLLYDRSLNGYHIQMGTIDDLKTAQGPISRRYGKFRDSTHPIQGSHYTKTTWSSNIETQPIVTSLDLFQTTNSTTLSRPTPNQVQILSLPEEVVGYFLVAGTKLISAPFTATIDQLIQFHPSRNFTGEIHFEFKFEDTTTGTVSAIAPGVIFVSRNVVPTPGNAGQMLYCDGVDDFAFAKDFQLKAKNGKVGEFGSPAYTVEFWVMHTTGPQNRPALFTMGQGEVVNNWCGHPNDSEEKWYCIGRSDAWFGTNAVLQLNWQPASSAGSISAPILDTWTTWTHYAIVVPGVDIASNEYNKDAFKFYRNGQLFRTGNNHWSIGDINGFHLCTFPLYLTNDFHYGGFIDEFRIYDHGRTAEQVLNDMHSIPSQSEISRMHLYYDFNVVEMENLDQVHNVPQNHQSMVYDFEDISIVKDRSPNQNNLVLAGCTPPTEPFCKSGINCGDITVIPKQPCYNSATQQEFLEGARPSILRSSAPIGGFTSSVSVLENSPITIKLYASDWDVTYDGTQLIEVTIATLPTRGNLYSYNPATDHLLDTKTSVSQRTPLHVGSVLVDGHVVYLPDEMVGGKHVDAFTYKVSDGFVTSQSIGRSKISVRCGRGRHVTTDAVRGLSKCVDANPGYYNPTETYLDYSIPCPVGLYQPDSGQSSCLECPQFHYQLATGMSSCINCLEFPNKQMCPNNGMLPKYEVFVVILAALCIFASITAIVIFIWRHHRLVHSASPSITIVSAMGSIICSVGAIYHALPQTSPMSCTLQQLLVHVGFHLFFTLKVAKGYRMHRIFNNILFSKVLMSNSRLFFYALIPATFDATLVAVWQTVAPFRLQSQVELVCVSEKTVLFNSLLISTKIIAIVAGVFVSYKARKVPASFYNHKTMYFVCYNTLLTMAITIIGIVSLQGVLQPSTVNTIKTASLTYALYAANIVIYLPLLNSALRDDVVTYMSIVKNKSQKPKSKSKVSGLESALGYSKSHMFDESKRCDSTDIDNNTTEQTGNHGNIVRQPEKVPEITGIKVERAKHLKDSIERMKKNLAERENQYKLMQQSIFLQQAEKQFHN